MKYLLFVISSLVLSSWLSAAPVTSGELKQWHKITITFDGPDTSETSDPNPFTDYRFDVTFSQGDTKMIVPGYYAADGDAAQTSAESGNKWRVHFSPPTTGEWSWKTSFRKGDGVAVADAPQAGESAGFFDGKSGALTIEASDKKAPDFRSLGLLKYVGGRYPVTQGNQKIFLKQGPDAPENLLSYEDFDGDFKTDGVKDKLVKKWEPHLQDWEKGDPTWAEGKGKGLIGAINYLSSKGLNSFSFLTMNIEGDDANVFPYLSNKQRDRLDVSRLAQWEIVFEHGTRKGMFLHFKTQETENETLLDEGETGPQRKLYYRELIARFAHHPGLNWNMGEENGVWGKHHHKEKFQTTEQRVAMGRYMEKNDPYGHPIVIHNGQWPNDLYGPDSPYNGASLQTGKEDFRNVHKSTLNILTASKAKGKQWMVACDEPGDAQRSLVPDESDPERINARQNGLWGQFLAGGWGCEWYFGYKFPHSDLSCQDFRSRDKFWDQCRYALEFFREQNLPLAEMENHNELLTGRPGFCLAKPEHLYLAIVKNPAKAASLELWKYEGAFKVQWFNPRTGGKLQQGSVKEILGFGKQSLGTPPSETDKDWVVLVQRK